jgi:hypothetical protein
MDFDSLISRVIFSQIIPSVGNSLTTVYIMLDNGFEYSQVFRTLHKEEAPSDITTAYSNMMKATINDLLDQINVGDNLFAEEFINYEHVYQGLQIPTMG